MSCRKSSAVSAVPLVVREVSLDPALFLAPERRVRHDDVDTVSVADLSHLDAEAVARIDARVVQAMQEQVHLAEQVGKWLGLAAEQAAFLQRPAVLDRLALRLEVPVSLNEESARAACRVEDRLPEARVHHLDDEADDGSRRVELPGVTRGVSHLPEHRFIKVPQRQNLFGGVEVNPADLVDDVSQEVAVHHPVHGASEDRGDHIAPVPAARALQLPEVGEEPWARFSVRPNRGLLVHEGNELVAGDSIFLRCPVAPAVRCGDRRAVLTALEGCLLFLEPFHVIEELQEEDPREHRQPVEVAAQAFVLPHDVPRGLDQAAETLRGRDG